MPIKQTFFEFRDIRPLQERAWIVLRQARTTHLEPPDFEVLGIQEFIGIGTAAVEADNRAVAAKLDWNDLGVGEHRAGVERWGYRSVDVFREDAEWLGVNLVIDQFLEHDGSHVWHIHPDLVVALRLLREGDVWLRPEEGWIDVVRLKRDSKGDPDLIEIRREFLADYLSARNMVLYCSSYRERVALTKTAPIYGWSRSGLREAVGRDRREAHTTAATYPDPKEQFRTLGALWRTEWVEPGVRSTRVRGDLDKDPISFVSESDGTRESPSKLAGAMTWLYFSPTLALALHRYRGATLHWFSSETGAIGASAQGLHFGINDLGLINIFAKDVNELAPWEQRIWAAHNMTPEGAVSDELFAAQMAVSPASTRAPEQELAYAIEALDKAFTTRYGSKLLREHGDVGRILGQTNRFRAAEPDGLFDLAKDLTRLFFERIDVDAVLNAAAVAKADRKIGSLKAVEKLVGVHRSPVEAREMMAPLFGIYDLRLAGSHLGSSSMDSALERAKVDDDLPPAMQGRQLLRSFVDTLLAIAAVL